MHYYFFIHFKVVSYDEIEDVCDIKYIDYGGYDSLAADQLRQIRTDFLSLPFQVSLVSRISLRIGRDICGIYAVQLRHETKFQTLSYF